MLDSKRVKQAGTENISEGEIMMVATRHETKYYFVYPSRRQIAKYDNGALISCGWTVGDDLPLTVFQHMSKKEVTQEDYNHSGCQSRCVLRGDSKCGW